MGALDFRKAPAALERNHLRGHQMARLSGVPTLVCLFVLANCGGEEWNCSSGECRFEYDATGCVTEKAHEEFTDHLDYINKTGDTSRIGYLYLGELCKRFPKGTIVYVVENGTFTVKVRFMDLPEEPDRWMSAEALRSVAR